MLNYRIILTLLMGWMSVACAADWPTYRGDASRSGFTADKLPRQLSLAWSYHPNSAPNPAWGRDDRMLFDRANEVVVTNGLVIFGSSADCRVVALDAVTGDLRWTYFTDAPARFAPAVWRDRVFVVSDDGYLYSLSTSDGSLQNRWRGGPSDELILGNGRMISRWPAASGVENFGGIRPGCWINALPVGGLVLVPDASAGCQCSYQNRSWLALSGDE